MAQLQNATIFAAFKVTTIVLFVYMFMLPIFFYLFLLLLTTHIDTERSKLRNA